MSLPTNNCVRSKTEDEWTESTTLTCNIFGIFVLLLQNNSTYTCNKHKLVVAHEEKVMIRAGGGHTSKQMMEI